MPESSAAVSDRFDLEVEPVGPALAVSEPFDLGIDDAAVAPPSKPVTLLVENAAGTTVLAVYEDRIEIESNLPVIENGSRRGTG